MSHDIERRAPQAAEPTDTAAVKPRRSTRAPLESRVLFAGGNEVVIFHYGETYRLRETRLGKLILTK
jgi:hemin uptake protein HemP